MELIIEELDNGCLPVLDVEPTEEQEVRTLTRPIITKENHPYTIEVGGLWGKPVIKDGRFIIQMVELDSDSLQFILKLLDPRGRDKIKKMVILKRKADTFGVLPMPKEPCKVGVAVHYDFTDPGTKERVERLDFLLKGWMDRKTNQSHTPTETIAKQGSTQ